MLKWWAQSFLVGIERVVVGFRDDDGTVHRLHAYATKQLPKEQVRNQHQAAAQTAGENPSTQAAAQRTGEDPFNKQLPKQQVRNRPPRTKQLPKEQVRSFSTSSCPNSCR